MMKWKIYKRKMWISVDNLDIIRPMSIKKHINKKRESSKTALPKIKAKISLSTQLCADSIHHSLLALQYRYP